MQRKKFKQITFQTRIEVDSLTENLLDEHCQLLSSVERKLFSDLIKGRDINSLKRTYIKEKQITARQFNSCRYEIEGKISSFNERKKNNISLLKQKIEILEKKIPRIRNKNKLHQKKRKLFFLKTKHQNLEKTKKPQICFGSKKLFHSQFHMQENGFENFDEWKKKWHKTRNSSFFAVGSKDETCGNQSCQAYYENGKISLKLRLSNKKQKYLIIKDIVFSYGIKEIIKAIESNLKRKELEKLKNASYMHYGTAICYRFKKDEKGYRVFITLTLDEPVYVTNKNKGLIGVDINSNHLAVIETDRYLNPIKRKKIKLPLYGKNKNQIRALIGDASKEIIEMAKASQKPIILEKLDFQKKKITLKEQNKRFSRMLNSFSYKSIINMISSKAYRSNIEIFDVNPAFTSIIGKLKFAKRYGLDNHLAAALTIARRYMQSSEKLSQNKKVIFFDAKGSMRAFFLPDRNRKKHLWSFYKEVSEIIKTTDAPYFQAIENRSSNTHMSVCEIAIPENYERNSHTLMIVDKTARSTSLKKSLL